MYQLDSSWYYVVGGKNKKYKKEEKKQPLKCGAIILNSNLDKVVLIKNNYLNLLGIEKYGLPKGHININESLSHCAMRELYEETGIRIKINSSIPKIKINNTYYFLLILNEELTLKPVDKKEICDAKWIFITNLNNLNLNRETKIFAFKKYEEIIEIIKKNILKV